MSLTETEQIVKVTTDGSHDKFSHIVYPASALTDAYVLGTPVTALCGKIWVPSEDPQKYPVCESCKEIYNKIRGEAFDGE